MTPRPDPLAPHPDRFPPDAPGRDAALAAHAAAVRRGEDGYVDPASGWFVFTATHLLERGSCCEVGCRHCPWLHADPVAAED